MEQPREPLDEDVQPATVADLRSIRRWLAVAAVWAVAATAIAVIALIEASNEDEAEADTAAAVSRQLSRVQRQLDNRLDSLERQVRELPQSEDVSRLENRLREAEDDSAGASRDASRARESVSDLEQRVEDLEQQQEDQQQQGGQQAP